MTFEEMAEAYDKAMMGSDSPPLIYTQMSDIGLVSYDGLNVWVDGSPANAEQKQRICEWISGHRRP